MNKNWGLDPLGGGMNEEFTQRLTAFFDYIHYGDRDIDNCLCFIAKNLIPLLSPIHISLYKQDNHPTISKLGQWGTKLTNELPEIGSFLNLSIENSFLYAQTEIEIDEENIFEHIGLDSINSRPIKLITIPVHPNLSLVLLINNEPSDIDRFLMKSISSIISLLMKYEDMGVTKFGSRSDAIYSKTNALRQKQLTDRQVLIKEGIVKGQTNREIALNIGFSESLVRQETVQIFKHFLVTRRSELMDIESNVDSNYNT
jgi:DNA-binding CsgD family transcriptional regulator